MEATQIQYPPFPITAEGLPWRMANRTDPIVRAVADRHYNRQKIGAKGFVPPGKCLVFSVEDTQNACHAFWVSSAPIAAYVRHAWAGAWVCTAFRNEASSLVSSELIWAACAATRFIFGDPPPLGMISFVDEDKTKKKDKPGWCYRKAGFKHVGFSEAGLWCMQLMPEDFPPPFPCLPPRKGLKCKYAKVLKEKTGVVGPPR